MAAPIAKERKAEIIHKIKEEGLAVSKASELYKVSTKAIYGWLSSNVGDASALELNRLRKENEQLYNIIGRITAELKTSKK
jgi:transposase